MDQLPVQNPELLFRQDGEEGVLFFPQTGQILHLNETATFIYSLLDGTRTHAQLAEAVAKRYDVSQNEAEADVTAFIQTLYDSELIGETA